MNIRLLATKFHIPPWRAMGVTRPHLLARLAAGLDENRKLTLVSAPVGYGKTTLVTEWIHSLNDDNPRVAWLSLDESDNDLERFTGYWLAAFQQVDGTIREKIQPLLSLQQQPPVKILLDELLNELATPGGGWLLALDDYHLISNPQIHEMLEYFLDHQPAHVHLVIITRQDPPLPLARLRARGQMTEIRARDLRFSPDEARRFFACSMKLDLPEETANAIGERTEGWAVGLQLAGLALQNLADRQRFIETFRGSHRYVLDYLAEEVIRQQGEEVRAFLTRTSVLARFNASVCRALTGRADAQAVIAHLEQANLFIVPLDDERNWYRYHQLFADYLQTELAKDELADLYKKAAAWHAEHDLIFEAVRYALASEDDEFAANWIEQAVQMESTWSGGDVATLTRWLEALPAPALQSRPRLSLHASRIFYLAGRFDRAEKLLDQVEQFLRQEPVPQPDAGEMLALAALYRGSIASVRGDFQQAVEQTTFAQARLPRENHLAHARGFFSLGLAYELANQTGRAVQNYLQSSDEARSAGVLFLAVHARCAAAQVQIAQGRLGLAEQTCQAAIQLAEGARLAPLGLAFTVLGAIALQRNDLASAGRLLQDGIALSRQGGLMDDVVLGLAFLASQRAAQGDAAGAFAAIQDANAIIQGYEIQRMTQIAAAYAARLQLFTGQKQAAARWAAEYQARRGAFPGEFEDLTLARVLLASGELEAIPSILHPLLEKADEAGRMQTCIEVMMLLGLLHHARKDAQSALDWLGKSLRLAAPEGYARIYLDEGKPLLELLPKVRHAAPERVDSLLGASQPVSEPLPTPLEQLVDPLSEQELRVLQLVLAGKSNQEIADELVISVGTAKWHVHNILQKLGVNNRAQAIALVRQA